LAISPSRAEDMPASSGFARGNGVSCAAADELKTPATIIVQTPDLVIFVLPALLCARRRLNSFLRSKVARLLPVCQSDYRCKSESAHVGTRREDVVEARPIACGYFKKS
jgi:hypothetical protein